MNVRVAESWQPVLAEEFEKPYFGSLVEFVKQEYAQYKIFPSGKHIFRALDACPFEQVRVVILGQDPYHGDGQANGLCFSVNADVPIPPSLRNIYKELAADVQKPIPTHGDLSAWTTQGVLLLNATLTVRAHAAGSHQNKGWEMFTDAIIKKLSEQRTNLVFLLWGNYAQQKGQWIDTHKHLVLKAAHPSPFSAHNGFFGCKHFSQANDYLRANGLQPIAW